MRRTIDRPNALAAATGAGLLEVLQACNSNLEKIHRSLEVYVSHFKLFSVFRLLQLSLVINEIQFPNVQLCLLIASSIE